MDIIEQLLLEMSRRNINHIAQYIGNDAKQFNELVNILFSGESPLPYRASWAISVISDRHPTLLKPYIKKIISRIDKFDHPGIRRNLLRYMSKNDLPASSRGRLYNLCHQWFLDKDVPPAIKVHSMQIMFNIAVDEPDLKKELQLILENFIHHESAAIKSRIRHLMTEL